VKKVILIAAALLMVFAGVAAVSAYEAHKINVKAHVENALTVDTVEMDFGTCFPEEILIKEANICLSQSANESMGEGGVSGNLSSVTYKVFGEYKISGTNPTTYYKWIGEWLWVGDENATAPDANSPNLTGLGWYRVGPEPDPGYSGTPDPMAMPIPGFESTIDAQNRSDMLKVMLLVPAFHDEYNAATDAYVKPQWWLDLIDAGLWPRLPGTGEPGVDLGMDLKIQVTNIARNP